MFSIEPRFLSDERLVQAASLSEFENARVLAVSGIARPDRFEETLNSIGAEVVAHFKFADHHFYSSRDKEKLNRIATEHSADMIVTTEKDMVRLVPFPGHRLLALRIDLDVQRGGARLDTLLSRTLGRASRRGQSSS